MLWSKDIQIELCIDACIDIRQILLLQDITITIYFKGLSATHLLTKELVTQPMELNYYL